MTGDCSIFNPVLLPYIPIYKTILSGIFSHAYFKRKVFFHQISKEKSAAYYIRARTIVREYARGRRERRNRFRPADVAFFSSESDKNVALNFPQNTVFQYTFQYTHMSSAGV